MDHKVIEFSTPSNPESWSVDPDGGVIEFKSGFDAKQAEKIYTDQAQEIDSLRAMLSQCRKDRDHAWDAFTRLRRGCAALTQ